MKNKIITTVLIISSLSVGAQNKKEYPKPTPLTPDMTEFWTPQPVKVKTSVADNVVAPPSDAIILFDGLSAEKWVNGDKPCQWIVKDGVLVVKAGTGDIETKESFSDCQLHLEWRLPKDIQGEGQGRGNSGLFLQGRYEVQILESEGSETYINGQAGSVYKQYAPLVNATRPAGEWNVYDIIFKAPVFKNDGTLKDYGLITVLHNGVIVQNNAVILGTTEYAGHPRNEKHGAAPLKIQDHGNPVEFRNIWIRKLD